MYSMGDWRKRNINMMDPRQYSFENYYTDVSQKKEMKHTFGDELLNNLHLLPDPLKKNLADSIITQEDNNKKTKQKNLLNMTVEPESPKMDATDNKKDFPPMRSFAGITSFFSGVLNVITGAVSQLRPKSPPQYYDCFDDSNVSNQGPPPDWQPSKDEDQNKSEWADQFSDAELYLDNMNKDYKIAVSHCEEKLNKVRMLLDTKPVKSSTFRSRRPRKVFVEPGTVEESFEDAFSPEEFVSVANTMYIKHSAQGQYQKPELIQTASPKVQTKIAPVCESTDIVKTLPDLVQRETLDTDDKVNLETLPLSTILVTEEVIKPTDDNNVKEVVSCCEDKLSKLKALLQERRKKNTKSLLPTDTAPEPVVFNDKTKPSKTVAIDYPKDKRFKNPCRTTDKRKKSKLRKSIQDDLLFAHEIIPEDISSAENSPSNLSVNRLSDSPNFNNSTHSSPINVKNVDSFDEVSGRFHSSYTDSDDSFQIVFNDSPKPARKRMPSDCESEDSFIIFEDSPDSCYTTNDVFGEESEDETQTEYSDSESELSDSGCVPIAKSSFLSRTIGDLTDDSLYDEQTVDEVDCAVRTVCDEIPSEDLKDVSEVCTETEVKSTGLLIDEAKKLKRKNQPAKNVHFSDDPPKVHVMRVWTFAARQARTGHWERCAIDRERFKRRIADVDMAVSWVLKPQHRSRVMFQRFMPWWNAQKRQELAEKKAREAEERIKKEEERVKKEEEEAKRIEEEEAKKIEDEELMKMIEEEELAKMIEEHKLKMKRKVARLSKKVNFNKTDFKNVKEQNEMKAKKICNGNLNGINIQMNKLPKNSTDKFAVKSNGVIKVDKNSLEVNEKQIVPVNEKNVNIEIAPENMPVT